MKNILVIGIILIASIILLAPLAKPGLHTIHDDQQVARLFVFDEALKSGQFPVRYVDKLGFGFGYPLFIFYPPLVYFVGETVHLIGFGFVDSIKIVFFLSIFLSGVAMYILVKDIWGKLEGLVGAIFYIFAPYRAIDVYVRGSLAEAFSFVWLPLILWSFYRMQKEKNIKFTLFSSIFLSLLMITHNLIFMPFMLILIIYLSSLLIFTKNKKYFLFNSIVAFVFASFLSAFFWIPAIIEKKYTIVDDQLIVNLANYAIHFVYPQQLWNWQWGFGGSAAGLMDGLSFKIGKLHVVLSVLTVIFVVFKSYLAKLKVRETSLTLTFFILFVFAAFMTTFYSKFIWDIAKPLAYLQFPWRFLTFTALFSSVLVGSLIYNLKLSFVKIIASVVLLVLLVVSNYKLFKPQFWRSDFTDLAATSTELISWDVSNSSYEYVPKGVFLVKGELGTNVIDIGKSELPKEKLELISGNANITKKVISPDELLYTIDAKDKSSIRANVFDFPIWQLTINGKQQKYSSDNKLKYLTFDVPAGISNVQLKFVNTPVRRYANAVTLVSVFLLFLFFFSKWKKLSWISN